MSKIKKALENALNKRQEIAENIKELEAEKGQLDNTILATYTKLKIDEFIVDDKVYRKQINEKVEWKTVQLLAFLANLFGYKKAYEIVKTEVVVNLVVDEDKIKELIAKEEITNKQMKEFIQTIPSKPFIRSYKVKV